MVRLRPTKCYLPVRVSLFPFPLPSPSPSAKSVAGLDSTAAAVHTIPSIRKPRRTILLEFRHCQTRQANRHYFGLLASVIRAEAGLDTGSTRHDVDRQAPRRAWNPSNAGTSSNGTPSKTCCISACVGQAAAGTSIPKPPPSFFKVCQQTPRVATREGKSDEIWMV